MRQTINPRNAFRASQPKRDRLRHFSSGKWKLIAPTLHSYSFKEPKPSRRHSGNRPDTPEIFRFCSSPIFRAAFRNKQTNKQSSRRYLPFYPADDRGREWEGDRRPSSWRRSSWSREWLWSGWVWLSCSIALTHDSNGGKTFGWRLPR